MKDAGRRSAGLGRTDRRVSKGCGDYKLEEMDLEDRCLLPRARAIAKVNAAVRFYG